MLYIGIDQAFRNTGICILETQGEEHYVHFYTVSTPSQPHLNSINEIFYVAPIILKAFYDYLENNLKFPLSSHTENYLAFEAPLEGVSRASSSGHRGASIIVTHELYGLYQQLVYQLLRCPIPFKMLTFHPNVARGFFGQGKISSINYRTQLTVYYGDRLILDCGKQKVLNDHNVEAWLYSNLMLFINNQNHTGLMPQNKDKYFNILKLHKDKLYKWSINYAYDYQSIKQTTIKTRGRNGSQEKN